MKKGLILEGGAMRGLFTAGVIDVMMEQGIQFDGAVGVSAGTAFGCNYKSGQIGRVLRYNTKFCRHPRYCGLRVHRLHSSCPNMIIHHSHRISRQLRRGRSRGCTRVPASMCISAC